MSIRQALKGRLSGVGLTVAALSLASGCAGLSFRSSGSEPVPPELVPDGYTASECHFTEQSSGGADAGYGGMPTSSHKSVSCKHAPAPAVTDAQCFVNGEQRPLDQCKQSGNDAAGHQQ